MERYHVWIENIYVDNVKDWCRQKRDCIYFRVFWAFRKHMWSRYRSVSRVEIKETIQELYTSFQESFPDLKIPENENPYMDCIKLTLDSINIDHHPLAFYAANISFLTLSKLTREDCLSLAKLRLSLFLSHCYIHYHPQRLLLPNQHILEYWYHPPAFSVWLHPSIMIIHGVDSILSLPYGSLTGLSNDIHLCLISMHLPRPSWFPSSDETSSQICVILDHHVSFPERT